MIHIGNSFQDRVLSGRMDVWEMSMLADRVNAFFNTHVSCMTAPYHPIDALRDDRRSHLGCI